MHKCCNTDFPTTKHKDVVAIKPKQKRARLVSERLFGVITVSVIKKHSFIFLQLVLLGIVAIGSIFINGWFGFKSVLLGGCAWFFPAIYFFWRSQQVKPSFDNLKLLKHFFSSEAIKLCLSLIIITVILLTCCIDPKGFLGGYVFMVLITFIVPMKRGT